MCHQQKEQNSLQSVPPPQVPSSGDVEERVPLRSSIQLVQNPLSPSGATTAATTSQYEHAAEYKTSSENATTPPPTSGDGITRG